MGTCKGILFRNCAVGRNFCTYLILPKKQQEIEKTALRKYKAILSQNTPSWKNSLSIFHKIETTVFFCVQNQNSCDSLFYNAKKSFRGHLKVNQLYKALVRCGLCIGGTKLDELTIRSRSICVNSDAGGNS